MKMTDKTTRCALSDLLVTECACRMHSRTPGKWKESEIQTWFLSNFDSKCNGCFKPMFKGDAIARTYDGDYVCRGCVAE